ncbi:MAG: helix-hairpin-helix domain-containing protein [Saprospiraceae bacterium]
MTLLAFSLCDLQLWHVVIAWLLPFLLGLLLGYFIWAKYKREKEVLEEEKATLKLSLGDLEKELDASKHDKTVLDSEISSLKGRLRERNLQLTTLEASLAAVSKKGGAKEIGKKKKISANRFGKKKKKKIEGIGSFIENKLNKIGIYTYDDLAEMDSARIEQVTQDIGFFPGRIERDNWVGQARDLMGDTTPESYGESTVAERIETEVDYIPNNIAADISADSDIANASENDLKMIEGIGPKIEQLLKSNGIMTWQALAESSVERLKEILTEAGNRYKMHNPSTWPDQARLAADGEWEKLKTYQDYLDGGLDKGGAN